MKNRRRLMIPAAAAFVMSLMLCSPAFAATENHVDRVVQVKQDTEFTLNNAPILSIDSPQSFAGGEDVVIELVLSEGEWLYSGESLDPNLEVKKIGSATLLLTIKDAYDFESNDVDIPIFCKVTGVGDVFIYVNGRDTVVSGGKYVFAQSNNGPITMDVGRRVTFGSAAAIDDIIIKDAGEIVREAGTKIKFELSERFRFFEGPENIVTQGKFGANSLNFSIDSENPRTAYLTVTESTPAKTGAILLSGIQIAPERSAYYGSNVELKMSYDSDYLGSYSQTNTIARYVQDEALANIKITEIKPNNGRPIFSGTAQPGKLIGIFLEDKEVGHAEADEYGNWSITYPNGRTKLAETEYIARAGYYRASTAEISDIVTMEFTVVYNENLPDESWKERSLKFVIDADYYFINGVKYVLDTPAFIDENNRTMLPLRTSAHVFGIPDEHIEWDGAERSVSLINGKGEKITLRINEQIFMVDDKVITVDTSAVIVNGHTYLPLRALANALGFSDEVIVWNAEEGSVSIN
ncbi:MAG: copper amine oxidase N-terminal domain-containing protein [Firmicutes bacterium]|nr:copper amine oxidase N-terminal domain-containing protein [Bacillota bacterium]